MGGRFWIGVVLLVCLLLAGFFVHTTLTDGQDQMVQLVAQAESFAHNNNMPLAHQSAQHAYTLWQQRFEVLASIADHEPLDETEATFRQLLAFGKEADTEEFCASCARLIAGIESIAQAHQLAWWNIL